MAKHFWTEVGRLIPCLVALVLTLSSVPGGAVRAADQPPKSKVKAAKVVGQDVFELSKIWHFDLHFDAKEYAAMQPPSRGGMGFPGGFGPPGGPPRPPEKKAGQADVHRSTFGVEFPWVRAEMKVDGQTYKDVGIRYKGNYTYMASARGLKRSLKIDLDRHDAKQRFHGLKKLNLNSGVTDPSKAREALSYAFLRAAGVPAPRTAFAEVTLTVPGKYDKEYLGVFTLVEQVDKTFLAGHFKNGKGMLLKPEGLQGGLMHLGNDWQPYEQRYRPKDEPTPEQKKRLIEFTRLINQAPEPQFHKEIASYLDVDAFLRYLAANALIANLDSFLGLGHNYYLYLRPDTNQFVFIPWDLDLSLGTWPAAGTPEQQLDLSIMHPHAGQNKLIDRLLANKEVNARYRKILEELTATCFQKDRLLKELDRVEKVLKEPLAREAKAMAARKEGGGGFGPFGGVFGQSVPPRMFFEKRPESVLAQLEGKKKGFVPNAFGFPGMGGPGGFANPIRPGEILPRPWQEQLNLTEDQKKKVAELQKEVDAKIRAILDEQQRVRLERLREGRPGGPGFGPGGPGFGPGRPPVRRP